MTMTDFESFEGVALEPALLHLKGFTSGNERKFNYWYAKEAYSGVGELVDLGSMTGSSTAPLAAGLMANARGLSKKVQTFDMFVKSWPLIPGEPLAGIEKGASFLHVFMENTAAWRDFITVHAGDICKIGWDASPIEYLLVDLMKSWSTAKAVVKGFFPAVLPGAGLIVHQDFCHYYTAWIHLTTYRLRYELLPVYEIPKSDSFVFRVRAGISPEAAAHAVDFANVTPDEVDDAFAYSESLVKKNDKASIRACKAMFCRHYAFLKGSPAANDEVFREWMDRARRELASIGPESQDNRDVKGCRDLIHPAP